MRTTDRDVVFLNPFTLPGIEGMQPPGSYRVSTDEEAFATSHHSGFRRISTLISVRSSRGMLEQHTIDPVDLEVALMRDAGTSL